MKIYFERLGPKLPRYYMQIMLIVILLFSMTISAAAADARRVYDQDNKGWKAIANAIKGRLIPDDDQYSLGVCLLSRRLPQNVCHIYLIPEQDAGDFLTLRAENYLPFSLTSGYNYGSIPK